MVHLHGLATAGAMLTCVAVVLNLGPFAKAPKIDSSPGDVAQLTARAIAEPSVAAASITGLETHPLTHPLTEPMRVEPAMAASDVPEPIGPSTEPPAVVEVAHSASQPATAKEAVDEIQAERPQHELAAANPAVHPAADQPDPELIKKATIVGVWAPEGDSCSARKLRAGVLPAVINAEGAWAGETFCAFKNKEEMETGWKVVAKCSNPRERWTANVRLTVHDNRLTWTSKRGTQVYTRCAPDVLMAAAR
jgi:hypothetical protein